MTSEPPAAADGACAKGLPDLVEARGVGQSATLVEAQAGGLPREPEGAEEAPQLALGIRHQLFVTDLGHWQIQGVAPMAQRIAE